MTRRQYLSRLRKLFNEHVPFNQFLGLHLTRLRPGRAEMRLAFRREFIGDSERPALHGGVLAALLDTACGAAVLSQVGQHDRISTLDLRVDYLVPGPMRDLVASAEVIRVGKSAAVAQARVRTAGSRQVVAEGKAVFSIRRKQEAS